MKAWIDPPNVVRDIAHADPAAIFHPDIAALYDTDVPDGTLPGATLIDGAWVNPAPPPAPTPAPPAPPAPPIRHISKLAFRNRFTMGEKIALEMASLDNAAASMPARQQAAALRAALKDQENASYIDLDRADTQAGVHMLETAGLLAAGRANTILTSDITEVERYKA